MNFAKSFFQFLLLASVPFLFWQCDNDDDVDGKGQLRIELTDAPIDDANIKGVFVTIAEVHVDGKFWSGSDTRQTVDLMTLQNGNVYSLGIAEVDGKKYDRISLVLDLNEDALGNSPGCYVLTQDDTKHDLSTTSAEEQTIEITGPEFTVTNATSSTVVVDFDLRKSLRYGNANEPASNYSFGTNAEMNSALRLVAKSRAGHIQGHMTDLISTSDRVVVYAYSKGTFQRAQETSPAADEQFDGAVTSAAVDAQGNYKLSWLKDGEYELVFASYEDDGANGTMDLQGTLNLSNILSIDLKSVPVGVAATVTIDVTVTGILPL